ncbi:HK97-gp10 family putative phage morphogenesis protein [Paenirhodobacter enshiensis]|uniref:Phage protein, HK97 gp10 family n=1 Tax=Paenirhodobacter enshiensis TaxID=1105367 RepID=A0A086XQM8_9RHOB|nr:HK97-gp10 family putative phage morphogenesis protein [Paenirhodobacter enshiensis]KFI24328.1 hypothetical protein CG50_10800 [Paenirhodobacter enshiensis]
MANSTSMNIEGLVDLDKAMDNLSKATNRRILRNALSKAAQPMADAAAANAPKRTGRLARSIIVGSKLNDSQKKMHRKLTAEERSAVTLFVGPSYREGAGGRAGHLVEFGTRPHINGGKFKGTRNPGTKPRPFMRPAFDAEAEPTVRRLKPLLWAAIDRAAKRAARRLAKGG